MSEPVNLILMAPTKKIITTDCSVGLWNCCINFSLYIMARPGLRVHELCLVTLFSSC